MDLRLVERVDKRKQNECWPWTGTINGNGYGQIYIEGRARGAHRLVLEDALGRSLLHEEQACHTCDNRRCCNPAHLFVGSAADNQRDKGAKGRAARGTKNGGGGRLTEEAVRSIRAGLAEGRSCMALGREHGVSNVMISHIKHGRQWGWLK